MFPYVQDVFKSRGFNEMSEDALAFVLKSDRLNMDEADILEKVTEWATVNSVVTGASLKEVAKQVINNVRFALLDPEKLSRVEKENTKKDYIPVREHLLCVSQFLLFQSMLYNISSN